MSNGLACGGPGQVVWTEEKWLAFLARSADAVARTRDADSAFGTIAPYASRIMRAYSSSFYVVTRFLPARKRRYAELIYANVRYPDEVVDTFPLTPDEKLLRLARWEEHYGVALDAPTPAAAVAVGVPSVLACFGRLVTEQDVPREHYRSFLRAMRADIQPRLYDTMEDLVDDYVYGSAIVVGCFLTYAFGVSTPASREPALAAARDLAVGLQMTNFLRDLWEDAARGRMYLPRDRWAQAGLSYPIGSDLDDRRRWGRLISCMAAENDALYASALAGLPAFAADARPAVRACIRVYRMLNDRLASPEMDPASRATVPSWQKFRALPPSKYWVLPGAFMVRR